MAKYNGGCHCGKIAFEVEGEISQVIECNCSICSKRAHLLWFVPRAQLRLSTPESNLGTYTFNTGKISHFFCPTCGIGPFGEGTGKDGVKMASVNVRCLEGVDLDTLKIIKVNGRDL